MGINAIIISKKDYNILYKRLKNKDICNQNILQTGIVSSFLKEYPCCDKEYNYNDGWENSLSGNNVRLDINHLCLIMEYSWESENIGDSMDETILFTYCLKL